MADANDRSGDDVGEGNGKKGYRDNIEELTLANTDFRRVLYTGEHLQLVLMTLKPGEEIGEEPVDEVADAADADDLTADDALPV